jgi:aminomethyltransferase
MEMTVQAMNSRRDDRFIRTEFASITGQPPYVTTPIRSRGGLKRTAFFPIVGEIASSFKLHNTYLKPDFFTDPVEEYWAIRRTAGLLDVTGEEVIAITGPDAEALLDSLMPRDVRKMKDGHSYYSVLLHDHGGIVEDGILVRFDRNAFWWIGGPGSSEEWLYANAVSKDVSIESFNDRLHVASLQGPRSRDILQGVCSADLAPVPFFGMLRAEVCGVPVTITRTGYTAELGYDIYVDVARGAEFFAGLWEAVRSAGGALCGSRTLGIRRVEAAILNFGQDFDWQHSPVEIGLGWMISASKAPYRAQTALQSAMSRSHKQKLAGLRLEGREVPLIGDKVVAGGTARGIITSATGSPALDCPIAICWLDTEIAVSGARVEVDLGGRAAAATVVDMPFLDPERKLARA